MAVDVIMPQMGESIFEGTITKWLKKAGDKIERDEPLFEISTDKVDAEIPSPSAGVLKEIKVNEGQTVPIQTVVAVIDADGAGATSATPRRYRCRAKPRSPRLPRARPAAAFARRPPQPNPLRPRRHRAAPSGEKVRSSPLVRKIARENNIDVAQVPGTGAGGRVSKQRHSERRRRRRRRRACRSLLRQPVRHPHRQLRRRSASARSSGNRRRLRFRGSRKRRAARKNVFRPLRSPAHVRDAPAHRGAHGALEARFAARVFGGRSGHDRHRHAARENEK